MPSFQPTRFLPQLDLSSTNPFASTPATVTLDSAARRRSEGTGGSSGSSGGSSGGSGGGGGGGVEVHGEVKSGGAVGTMAVDDVFAASRASSKAPDSGDTPLDRVLGFETLATKAALESSNSEAGASKSKPLGKARGPDSGLSW